MKILITGICGFVGTVLAKSWLESKPGVEIYGVDNFIRPGSEYNRNVLQKLGIHLYHGDIRVASDFEILPAVDWVIDSAANPSVLAGVDGLISSRQLLEHNLLGTVNILEYCRRSDAGFILLSTSRVYSISALAGIPLGTVGGAFFLQTGQPLPVGLGEKGVDETFSTAPPLSLYGSTKLASEVLALEYGEAFGFPVWINRCGVLAGGGQFGRADQGIFSFWINAWLRKRPLSYIGFGGNGHQVRDGLHPRDLLLLLLKQTDASGSVPNRVINLGGGIDNAMSLAGLSQWCRDRFGPHQVASSPENRRYDVPWMVMDSTLAWKLWGWRPQTSLAAILEEIAQHAEKHPDWLAISGLS